MFWTSKVSLFAETTIYGSVSLPWRPLYKCGGDCTIHMYFSWEAYPSKPDVAVHQFNTSHMKNWARYWYVLLGSAMGIQVRNLDIAPIPTHIIPAMDTGAQPHLWCGSPSHRYFCTTKIGYPVFPRSPIPLAKTLRLMRGNDWLEEIQIGSKLTEI